MNLTFVNQIGTFEGKMQINDRIDNYSSLIAGLLASDPIRITDLNPSTLPNEPGIYRILETVFISQETIYLGESTNLSNRLYRSHLMGNTSVSTLKKKLVQSGEYVNAAAVKEYLRRACSLQFVIVQNKLDRMRLEHFAIAVMCPKYND